MRLLNSEDCRALVRFRLGSAVSTRGCVSKPSQTERERRFYTLNTVMYHADVSTEPPYVSRPSRSGA